MRNVGEKEKNGKRKVKEKWILLSLLLLCCDMWTNME